MEKSVTTDWPFILESSRLAFTFIFTGRLLLYDVIFRAECFTQRSAHYIIIIIENTL